jgi:hypothetical protein
MAAEGNFFSRWSRQKAQAQAPVQVQAEVPLAPVVLSSAAAAANPAAELPAPVPAAAPDPTAPTLADVARLTPQSDFAPYMGRAVTQAVKNAALKKLFADPHFNVMDGLDIYIDDYSIPSPLSPEDLKNMVAAQFVKLVEEPPPTEPASADAAPSDTPHGTDLHDHPDLQLQPDDAAQRPRAEPGA